MTLNIKKIEAARARAAYKAVHGTRADRAGRYYPRRVHAMHTKDILSQALTDAGLPEMAAKAAAGHYHDFLSPLPFPELELDGELRAAGTPAAEAVRKLLHDGIFDATIEESDDWAQSEDGQDTMRKLIGVNEKIRGG